MRKPRQYLVQPPDPLRRRPAAAQLVIFSLKETKTAFHSMISQCSEHLHCFRTVTPVVLRAMNEQGRRLCPVCIGQRRLFPKRIHVVPRCGAALICNEAVSDVRGTEHGNHVGDASLADRTGKPFRVPYDPIHHKAAVGAAAYAHTRTVDLRPACQRIIQESHNLRIEQDENGGYVLYLDELRLQRGVMEFHVEAYEKGYGSVAVLVLLVRAQ